MQTAVKTTSAPAAIGPYSQGVVANGFVFVSGQIPLDPTTGTIVPGAITQQTHQSLKNVSEILKAAGSDLSRVVKTTVFLQSMEDFAAMNAVYSEYFSGAVLPARAAVEVGKLPRGALVEIEVIATV